MECVECGSEDSHTVIVESITCKHCGGEVRIEYNICKACGFTWKTVDGETLADVSFVDDCLDKLFDEDGELNSDITLNINQSTKGGCMKNYVHRCLRCQTLCFETEEDRYECPECGFIWEVVRPK